MSVPVLYAIGIVIANVPWYVMAMVPFWGSERFNKKAVVAIILSVALLRALTGGIICAFAPNWKMWDTYFLLFYTCLQLATFYICFKADVAKQLYTLLLLIVLATSANFLANMIVRPFYPDPEVIIAAHPAWFVTVAILIAGSFPSVYQAANGLLRRAFADLPAKSFLPLCVIPAMFYVISCVYVITLGTSTTTNMLVSFLIVFSGVISSYTTLRMVTDTAKHIRAEKELAAENATLDRINNLKTELMETISHEARTPLAVLASYSSLIAMELRNKGVDEQTTADLDMVAYEAKRVAGLIDSMKRLTLRDTNAARRVSLDIGELIRQTARLYSHILQRGGVELAVQIPDNLPPVIGSPEELTQVLLNLLQNARNHTTRGGVAITAKSCGDCVAVTVADNGAGIAPELMQSGPNGVAYVFKRGARGEGGGSGIGLSICFDVIKSHGGKIEIESELAKGTAVTFTLPIHADSSLGGSESGA